MPWSACTCRSSRPSVDWAAPRYLPDFPFRAISNVTWIHAAHHVNMSKGNYATLTMIYDWMFGTLEKPVSRPTP